MKIGIVSDSHGRQERLRAALSIFASRGVDAIVHCGDVGSPECIELLGTADASVYVVAGNMDRHVDRMVAAAARSGVRLAWEVIEVPLGEGRSLVATHGSDEQVLDELIAEGKFAYVCHGHTHRARDERCGDSRVINPGALHSPRRPGRPTVAVLDTDSDDLEQMDVPG